MHDISGTCSYFGLVFEGDIAIIALKQAYCEVDALRVRLDLLLFTFQMMTTLKVCSLSIITNNFYIHKKTHANIKYACNFISCKGLRTKQSYND